MPITSDARQAAGLVELAQASARSDVSEQSFREIIDLLPAAIYTTDTRGRLTYFNPACIEFSGHTPELGTDRWCVTWKLYHPDGRPMPHDKCPMAVALQEHRAVRGEQAIAERPDGTRIWFEPYPTPLCEADGTVVGGINMLVDITERKLAEDALRQSEKELADFFENAVLAVHWVGPDGVILRANQAELNLLGYNSDEYVGHHIAEFFADQDEIEDILRKLQAGETLSRHEARLRCKDGSIKDVAIDSNVLWEDDCFVHTRCFTRDVTELKQAEVERKRVEGALRDRERQFASIFDQSTGGIAQTDLSGRFVLINDRYCEIVGRSREELLKLRIKDITYPDDMQANLDKFRTLVETSGPNYVIEKRYVRPDGSLVWVHNDVAAIRDDQNRVRYVAAAVTDISERKKIEDELREGERLLVEADRRKDEFLATLAHELRNPLAPISSSVQIMRMTGVKPEVAEQARQTIERQVTHLVRLVDDLLDVSRISRNKLELRREPISLAVIVQSAVETSRPLIEASDQQLAISLPPQTVWVNADLTRMAQAVANLLNNAAKYTPERGRIHLSVEREDKKAVVRVRDTGIGIPHAMLPHIFEMFRQVDTSQERLRGGLGIGLTLVKNLVEMHGGMVEAHSDGAGRGSEFVVRLPVAKNPTNAPADAVDETPETDPRRILIVDDNRDSAESLAVLLEYSGHETRTAHDGLEAMEAAEAFRPDVILLDIGMPKLNGYEVARRIRQQPWGGNMVLVALTGWGQEEDRARSREAGFDHHFVKPVEHSAVTRLLADQAATSD